MKFHLRNLSGDIGREGRVKYWLEDMDGVRVCFNDFIGMKITISDTGERKCRICGKSVDRITEKGSCFECFKTSPRCDICMIKPELCHFEKGTCRDKEFARKWCFNNQKVYFSLTSGPKVGYLSCENFPQRWIDQGATQAIVLADAKSRLEAGEIETYLAQFMKDKTNRSAMLKGEILENADLIQMKKQWASQIDSRWPGRVSGDNAVIKIEYPVLRYPRKISASSLDKVNRISGVLMGIRGQYLLFRDGVFSVKKHEGYIVEIDTKNPTFSEVAEQGSLF